MHGQAKKYVGMNQDVEGKGAPGPLPSSLTTLPMIIGPEVVELPADADRIADALAYVAHATAVARLVEHTDHDKLNEGLHYLDLLVRDIRSSLG